MSELISNGERLLSVRQKLNATLRPYASRAEFELATVPEGVTLINVIDGSAIYQLTRDTGGDWTSGDGATWQGRILDSVAQSVLEGLLADAQAAVDETGADVIAAEAAQAGAQTALTGAETARDAAFVNADVYADIAAGRAAVADGEQFQVVSGDDLIRYRRDSATTQTELARYPSAAAVSEIERLVVDSRADRLVSLDIFADAVWNDDTYLSSTGNVSSLSNYRATDLIQVLPGDVIDVSVAPKSPHPDVVGYDAAGSFFSVLLTGGSGIDADTGLRASVRVTVPAGVAQVRLGETTTARMTRAVVLSGFEANFSSAVSGALDPASEFNLMGAKLRAKADGTTSLANGISSAGSGFVPVAAGDTLVWHLNGRSGVYALGLFDADRTLVRFLATDAENYGVEKRYTLHPVTDADVAYALAGSIDELSRAYFYVEGKTSFARRVDDVRAFTDAKLLRRAAVNLSAVGSNPPTLGSDPEPSVTFLGSSSFLRLQRAAPPQQGYDDGFFAVKLRIDALPDGVTEAQISWVNSPAVRNAAATTVAVGDEVVLWSQFAASYNYLQSSVSGLEVTVLNRAYLEMAPEAFSALDDRHLVNLIGESRFFDSRFAVPERAFRSYEAETLRTRWQGKKGAYFGNSIQYMMWPYVAPIMGLDMTQITVNGGDAMNVLTDANIALVPSDAALVTLSFGTGNRTVNGGYVPAETIDSRDRTTSEGAINFAMDWLTTNRPNAFVMFISPIYCGEPNRDNTLWYGALKALAEYWQVPYCDVWNNADISARNWSLLSYDNVHLTPDGIERQGGVIAAKLRSLSW